MNRWEKHRVDEVFSNTARIFYGQKVTTVFINIYWTLERMYSGTGYNTFVCGIQAQLSAGVKKVFNSFHTKDLRRY